MVEVTENDMSLEAGPDIDTLRAASEKEFGINGKEVSGAMSQLAPYMLRKLELARLQRVAEFLKVAGNLQKIAEAVPESLESLLGIYGEDAVSFDLRNFADALSATLSEGDLLKAVDPDEDPLTMISQSKIDAAISMIQSSHLEGADGKTPGRITRKENELNESYLVKARELMQEAQAVESTHRSTIADIAAKLRDGELEAAFKLMEEGFDEEAKTMLDGSATMTVKTTRKSSPLGRLVEIALEIERLDRFARKRDDIDINQAFPLRSDKIMLSDDMNLILNVRLGTSKQPVPKVTGKEELKKERRFYEDQLALLQEIGKLLEERPEAIAAAKELEENGLMGLLKSLEEETRATLEKASETAGVRGFGVAKHAIAEAMPKALDDKIAAIMAKLPLLKTAVEKRINQLRRTMPVVMVGREIGLNIYNWRQFAALILGMAALGATGFFTAKGRGWVGGISQDQADSLITTAETDSYNKGLVSGKADGLQEGRATALGELAKELNLNLETPTVEQIVAALIPMMDDAENSSAKQLLKDLIRMTVEKGVYTSPQAAWAAAGVPLSTEENDKLNAEGIKAARENLLTDLIRRVLAGDSSNQACSQARAVFNAIINLDDTNRARIRTTLQSVGKTLEAAAIK